MSPFKPLVFVICLFGPLPTFCQHLEDFSDGDFTHNPEWVGDTALFKVNSAHQLQLSAPTAGTAHLSTLLEIEPTDVEWKFHIKLAFAPSANNYARIYLAATDTNLKSPNLHGFYLQFGESLSNDAIELFCQEGAQHTSVCRGRNGDIAQNFDLKIKVIKDINDQWEIYVDSLRDDSWNLQASGTHVFNETYYSFGFFCQFTAGNKDKFYFDDLYWGPPGMDTIFIVPPVLLHRNDIIISEIMADPTPIVQLPEVEYLELHNCLPRILTLTGWKLKIGNSLKTLPEIVLDSLGYAVIVAQSNVATFNQIASPVYGVSSLAIADAGQSFILYDDKNKVINSLSFKREWHRNKLKQNGGWALEIIDANSPCLGAENWDSSISETGGTPGASNSIAAWNPDIEFPEILKITVLDSVTLCLFFTKPVMTDSARLANAFRIDHGITIQKNVPEEVERKTVLISVSTPFQYHIIYTLTLSDTLCDCAGNFLLPGAFVIFGLPLRPEKGDVIINEVLSYPRDGTDADYVELYNKSNKIIDLREILIGNGDGELPSKTVIAVSDGYLLFPRSYVALCKSLKTTLSQYYVPYPERLLSQDSLPAYANNKGTVHLTDRFFNPIDRFSYTDKMFYVLLTSHAGVSLERIHFDGATDDANNWTSAAVDAGFGTPGYLNSQFSELFEGDDIFKVIPEIFSPNGDGMDDYTEFCCHFSEIENRVTIAVYDRSGAIVKTIANNQPCAANACFRWDGITEKGNAAAAQLYVVKMQFWNISGKKKSMIRVVGIAP